MAGRVFRGETLVVAGVALSVTACTTLLGGFEDEGGAGGASSTTGASGSATGTGSNGTGAPTSGGATTTASGGGPPKRVFVTRSVHLGNFGAAGSAHALCQSAADQAGLGGSWVAWLSEGGPVTCSGGPWALVDGTLVGFCDNLNGGTLKHPIDLDEKGAPFQTADVPFVWTGLRATNGLASEANCLAWQSMSGEDRGTVGSLRDSQPSWTDTMLYRCDKYARFYCFEN